jgi:hypothetical protein
LALRRSVLSAPYNSWAQLAGYFDGDGSIVLRKTSRGIPFTLNISLEFVDQSFSQIKMIKNFLQSRGIKSGKLRFSIGAWRIEVGTIDGVKATLNAMAPLLHKKAEEAQAALRYLDDQITGNDLQEIMEECVRKGTRERFGRRVDVPWTRVEGLTRAGAYVANFAGRKPALTVTQEAKLVGEYLKSGQSQAKFAECSGLSRDILRGALMRQGHGSSPRTKSSRKRAAS